VRRAQRALRRLVGLRLSIARRAADMAVFHFGRVTELIDGSVGEVALHVQCPWRIRGPRGVVTGRSDLWEPLLGPRRAGWDYERDGNVLDDRLWRLLGGYDKRTRSAVNDSSRLTVESVAADAVGGAAIRMSGGYHLELFPEASRGEEWRLFVPGSDHHFVVGRRG
jgi:hypothetical protein